MRPAFRVLRAVAALGASAFLVVPAFMTPATAEDQTVAVGQNNENRFTPATVRIKPGDTVTWQYAGGSGHNVTSSSANWDKSDPVGPPALLNFTTEATFSRAGTYRYVCTTHEDVGMKGTVIVEGTVKPSPTKTRTSSPRPTTTRTATSSPRPSETVSETPSPTPSSGTASPAIPSGSVAPPSATSTPLLPSVAPDPETPKETFLGAGGLTPQPATGREKGLPVMLALLLIGGVGSAELRALLASAPPSP
ncbi:MAG TPA: plastocyanin/azurin family copper-binding protein [Frankiaceae bacterium]|nr:plastocyanin/azurin family copper-binding protein [Frankiaceae bacterium]